MPVPRTASLALRLAMKLRGIRWQHRVMLRMEKWLRPTSELEQLRRDSNFAAISIGGVIALLFVILAQCLTTQLPPHQFSQAHCSVVAVLFQIYALCRLSLLVVPPRNQWRWIRQWLPLSQKDGVRNWIAVQMAWTITMVFVIAAFGAAQWRHGAPMVTVAASIGWRLFVLGLLADVSYFVASLQIHGRRATAVDVAWWAAMFCACAAPMMLLALDRWPRLGIALAPPLYFVLAAPSLANFDGHPVWMGCVASCLGFALWRRPGWIIGAPSTRCLVRICRKWREILDEEDIASNALSFRRTPSPPAVSANYDIRGLGTGFRCLHTLPVSMERKVIIYSWVCAIATAVISIVREVLLAMIDQPPTGVTVSAGVIVCAPSFLGLALRQSAYASGILTRRASLRDAIQGFPADGLRFLWLSLPPAIILWGLGAAPSLLATHIGIGLAIVLAIRLLASQAPWIYAAQYDSAAIFYLALLCGLAMLFQLHYAVWAVYFLVSMAILTLGIDRIALCLAWIWRRAWRSWRWNPNDDTGTLVQD